MNEAGLGNSLTPEEASYITVLSNSHIVILTELLEEAEED